MVHDATDEGNGLGIGMLVQVLRAKFDGAVVGTRAEKDGHHARGDESASMVVVEGEGEASNGHGWVAVLLGMEPEVVEEGFGVGMGVRTVAEDDGIDAGEEHPRRVLVVMGTPVLTRGGIVW